MSAEAGAAGVITKLATMFAASATGAAIIAAYHPETRKDTWWQALGAGIGGLVFGRLVLKALASEYEMFRPGQDVWDWLSVAAPVLFLFGGVFWGLVGVLRQLKLAIEQKGAQAIIDRITKKRGAE